MTSSSLEKTAHLNLEKEWPHYADTYSYNSLDEKTKILENLSQAIFKFYSFFLTQRAQDLDLVEVLREYKLFYDPNQVVTQDQMTTMEEFLLSRKTGYLSPYKVSLTISFLPGVLKIGTELISKTQIGIECLDSAIKLEIPANKSD